MVMLEHTTCFWKVGPTNFCSTASTSENVQLLSVLNRKSGVLFSVKLTAMKIVLRWIVYFSLGFVTECQENHYGLKGSSIHLRIGPRNQSHWQEVVWRRFNKQQLLANSKGVHPDFEKMSLNVSDWSLTIHNLQEDDSGLYEALDNWERETLAAFTLIVENTVSKPVFKVNQYNFNSSAGVCQATVNCSADGSWAIYDCNQNRCAVTQASLSSVNITVTALYSSGIQCHVNNHVSKSHSQTPYSMCHEKLQSYLPSSPSLFFWIFVTIGAGVLLGLIMGLTVLFIKRRKCSKVHLQSSPVVIEQHHETIYSTVEKPAASQTSPENNTVSNKVETIYDTPSRDTKACQVDSVEVMRDNQEQDRTIQVKATIHQAAEPDSDPINTVYCKLGEI